MLLLIILLYCLYRHQIIQELIISLISALESIEQVNRRNDNIILIRSTIIPGTTKKLDEKFKKLNIVFNPEFLTERSAKFDFINQSRFIIGGDPKFTNMVAQLYK